VLIRVYPWLLFLGSHALFFPPIPQSVEGGCGEDGGTDDNIRPLLRHLKQHQAVSEDYSHRAA
jgi:hypothetical protein